MPSAASPLPGLLQVHDERTARATWSLLAEPGDRRLQALLQRHDPLEALHRAARAPHQVPGAPDWAVRAQGLDPHAALADAEARGLRLLVPGDDAWPPGLDDLGPRRPVCLWSRGAVPEGLFSRTAVAVVGSRAATAYGEHCTTEIAGGLASSGHLVVSGAAYGVDAAAHQAALARQGPTVAVLACGADRVYPAGHRRLLERIAHDGAVLSEVPGGTPPTRWRFLHRNRLIAALAEVVVVVEAGTRSGTHATAREALDLMRHVAAVPGPVTSALSAGCHQLLRDGAVCVTSAAEVAELAAPVGAVHAPQPLAPWAVHDDLDAAELRVLDAVPLTRPAPLGGIVLGAGLRPASVLGALTRLETKGLVRARDAGWTRVAVAGPHAPGTST